MKLLLALTVLAISPAIPPLVWADLLYVAGVLGVVVGLVLLVVTSPREVPWGVESK